jgi:hypothetical protein
MKNNLSSCIQQYKKGRPNKGKGRPNKQVTHYPRKIKISRKERKNATVTQQK